MNELEFSLLILSLREPALYLAGGSLRHTVLRHQPDGVNLDLDLFIDRSTNRTNHVVEIRFPRLPYFGDQAYSLFVVFSQSESGKTTGPKGRVHTVYRSFDILRIVVAAANYDELLGAPTNEELAVSKKSEIAGSHIRAGTTVFLTEVESESFPGSVRIVPVAVRHGITPDQDLPHPVTG
tara:strand:+ start:222 stop:761 length:540 start_codon:yes stop_codon:yes gene_type:complete